MKHRIWHNRKGPGRTHHHGTRVNSGGTKWLAPEYRPKKRNPRVEK